MKATRLCSVAGCDLSHFGKGYCQKHYFRWRRTGDTATVRQGHRFTEVDAATRLRERSEWQGGCLIYTAGHSSRSGHVTMGFKGRYPGVHRIAWTLANGEIPAGQVVRHTCDNPRCINVAHLELGTVADNNDDRDSRGRHVALPGTRNGSAKLTEANAREIRRRLAEGETQYALADEYGVHQAAIWSIKAGRTWRSA